MMLKTGGILTRPCFALIQRYYHRKLSPVKPGALIVNSPVNISITPARAMEDLTSCLAEVTLTHSANGSHNLLSELCDVSEVVNVNETDTSTQFQVSVPKLSEVEDGGSFTLNISIPHHYGVKLRGLDDVTMKLSSLETDNVDLTLENGNCELYKMKAIECRIIGADVNVLAAKNFVGNLSCSLQNGSLLGDKIQGQAVTVTTGTGNINIKSLYSTTANLKCHHGDITIGNSHGSTLAYTHQGNITARSVDGELRAETHLGDITAHLTDFTTIDLTAVNGSVQTTVSDTATSSVDIETSNLNVEDSLILDIDSRDVKSSRIIGTLGDCANSSPNRKLIVKSESLDLGVMDWITAQRLLLTLDT